MATEESGSAAADVRGRATVPATTPLGSTAPGNSLRRHLAGRWLVLAVVGTLGVSIISAFRPFDSLEQIASSALAIAKTPSVQAFPSPVDASTEDSGLGFPLSSGHVEQADDVVATLSAPAQSPSILPSPPPSMPSPSQTQPAVSASPSAAASGEPSRSSAPSAPSITPSATAPPDPADESGPLDHFADAGPAATPSGTVRADSGVAGDSNDAADAAGEGGGALPDYLVDTAVVTLATGDESGRFAVAWAQALRDVDTRIPNVIVLLSRGGVGSAECNDAAWKQAQGRESVTCSGPDTIAGEIISPRYIAALERLHVKVQVIDPIPDTTYISGIPGGRQIFWGMAFNKLRIFDPEYMPYRKVLWYDADTLVLKNTDHLLRLPMFSAAFTYACCNGNGPAQPSGGNWVVEPSREVADTMYRLIAGPVPGTNDGWHWGDMQVVRYMFGAPPPPGTTQPLWPAIEDGRHGYVEGLSHLPSVAGMGPSGFDDILARMPPEKRLGPGFRNESWDGQQPRHVWRSLDILHDQCIGHCECLPDRDIPTKYYSIHFSCIHHVAKPSGYATDEDFQTAVYSYALSCTRYYYMLWYGFYKKGMGTTLPEPLYRGPKIPIYDAQHDDVVRANRARENNLL